MKRGIVLLGLVWIMVGCSLPGRLQPVDPAALVGRPFTSEIQLTWDGEEYTGEFSRDEQGGIQLCLTGEYLETPLCFSSGPLGCTMTQGDLSVTFAARSSCRITRRLHRTGFCYAGPGTGPRRGGGIVAAGRTGYAVLWRRDVLPKPVARAGRNDFLFHELFGWLSAFSAVCIGWRQEDFSWPVFCVACLDDAPSGHDTSAIHWNGE